MLLSGRAHVAPGWVGGSCVTVVLRFYVAPESRVIGRLVSTDLDYRPPSLPVEVLDWKKRSGAQKAAVVGGLVSTDFYVSYSAQVTQKFTDPLKFFLRTLGC